LRKFFGQLARLFDDALRGVAMVYGYQQVLHDLAETKTRSSGDDRRLSLKKLRLDWFGLTPDVARRYGWDGQAIPLFERGKQLRAEKAVES
jgi:hypothetical protein